MPLALLLGNTLVTAKVDVGQITLVLGLANAAVY